MNDRLLCVLSCSILALPVAAQSPDADAARAAALAALAQPGAAQFQGSGPRELFHEPGDDNVVALLVHDDVDGDGVREVVTGWDIFKTGDNLTVSRGSGFLPGQLVWGLETADGISGGYFGSQEALASFPDATADGVPELLAGTGGGGRAATLYDGATGAVLQSFNTYLGSASGWVYDVAVVGDVNGNGTVDFAVATGSDDDAVSMVDGGSVGVHHDTIWRHQGADVFYAVVALGDIDGDGVTDVAAANGDNATTVKALSGATGAVLWSTSQGGNTWHALAVPDTNGDGIDELACASWQALGVRLRDGATGALLWAASAGSTLVQRVVPVPDVDGDGVAEVAAAGSSGGCSLFSGADGALLWNRNVGSNVWAVDPVGDVTGDGLPELAFGDFTGLTRLVDGSNGITLWSHSANGHKVMAVRGAPDLDGDGAPEVLIGAQQLSSATEPMLFVVDADSGVHGSAPELNPAGAYPLGAPLPLLLSAAQPGHTAYTLIALDPALVPLGAKGTLALDPGAFLVLLTQTVPASGVVSTPLLLPTDSSFDGVTLYLQTFVVSGSPLAGRSSNRLGLLLGN